MIAKEIQQRFASLDIDIKDVKIEDIVSKLKENCQTNGLGSHLQGSLLGLLTLPLSREEGQRTFIVASRLLRQVCLNKQKIGLSEDHQIDLAELVTAAEPELKELPLKKELDKLKMELETVSKEAETLKIELKERDEQLTSAKIQLSKGGGSLSTPAEIGVGNKHIQQI